MASLSDKRCALLPAANRHTQQWEDVGVAELGLHLSLVGSILCRDVVLRSSRRTRQVNTVGLCWVAVTSVFVFAYSSTLRLQACSPRSKIAVLRLCRVAVESVFGIALLQPKVKVTVLSCVGLPFQRFCDRIRATQDQIAGSHGWVLSCAVLVVRVEFACHMGWQVAVRFVKR